MSDKLQVGQTVWVYNTGRYRGAQGLSEEVVSKVGNKYFYLKGFEQTKFEVATLKQVTQFTTTYTIYLTKEAYEIASETGRLNSILRQFFSSGYGNIKLPLTALKQIEYIIETNKQ